MARVDVVGEKVYREELASQGFINPFSYKEGTIHETAILKVASDRNDLQEYKIGKLPSWIFTEDVLGVKPTINEIAQTGEFIYDVRKTAEENIQRAVTAEDGIDLNKFLANSQLVAIYKDNTSNLDELVQNNDRNGVYQWIMQFLPTYKENFIKTRTQLLIAFGATVTTNVKDSYRKGTINLENKEDKIVSRYFKLTDAIMEKKFIEKTGLTEEDKKKDPKEYKKKYRDYLFKAKEPLTRSRQTGILYMATREVILYNGQYLPKANADNSEDFQLKYFTLSGTKYKKMAVRRSDPGLDSELDYVMFRIEYMGETKAEAGRNMTVLGQSTRLKPEEIYDVYASALPELSYKKCYDLQEYPIDEVVGAVTEFLTENASYLENLTGEEKERLGDSLDIINNTVKKDDIGDLLDGVSEMFNQPVQSAPVQQPVQQSQQAPVQQPQQAPVQQAPVQQPAQQPVQQAPVQQPVQQSQPQQGQTTPDWANQDMSNFDFPQF